MATVGGPIIGALRAFRRSCGLTQEELAEASGLSVRAIREIESGRVRTPQRRTALILADAMSLGPLDRAAFLAGASAPSQSDAIVGDRAENPLNHPPVPRALPSFLPVPRELPAATGDLSGRNTELSAIAIAASAAAAGRRGASIVSVHGPPGVGKTALALAAGHLTSGYFPDGQLYLELDGIGPRPMGSAEALTLLLRSVGVSAWADGAGAGQWRTVTHDRRLLVVLDDVVDEAQVRPLLPSGPRCLVLMTHRRTLAGLEGAVRVPLEALTPPDSVRLLAGIVGGERIGAEPRAAERLADLCGQLPLALRIAGNRLASRPQWTVGVLVRWLTDQPDLLAALTAGDLDLRRTFASSYQRLDPTAAAVFRHASAIPGPDLTAEAAAASAGLDEKTALLAVEELVDAGLFQAMAPTRQSAARYRFPPLLRLFANQELRTRQAFSTVDS